MKVVKFIIFILFGITSGRFNKNWNAFAISKDLGKVGKLTEIGTPLNRMGSND